MTNLTTTFFFKILRTEGVGVVSTCKNITYVGKSRLDGYPVFKIECDPNQNIISKLIRQSMIVNTKPGYTLGFDEIKPIPNMQDELTNGFSISSDIIPVKPLSAPTGLLYYIDFVYDDLDPRLLLM
jgi:hypothetical protein